MDISGWIEHWGRWMPANIALRFEGGEISYAELERAVALTAGSLRENGVRTGDRVGFLGPNCPELLELLYACSRLGAIFVPLSPRMAPAELRVFVELTRPQLLVAEDGVQEVALACLDGGGSDRVLSFAAGKGLGGSVAAPEGVQAHSGFVPAAPVLIVFTSGTAGFPKGATFSGENITFNALNVITAFRLTAEDQILTAVPLWHVGGLLIHTTPGLCAGATITIHREFDPGLLLEEVERAKITLLASVPTMTFALTAHPSWVEADLSSLRCVVTGSTMVSGRAIEPWQSKGVPVAQGYGMTETCPIVTTIPPDSPRCAAFTAGKPVLHHRIRVVDETGGDVAPGQPGEIWIRGPSVMQGYWEDEHGTSGAFHNGWFRGGDIGLVDENGYLHIVDRIKDTIIVGSANVYPSDVESVLEGCAEVREAAVLGRPDDEMGEVPVAFVVPAPGHSLTREQVIGLFEGRLAPFKHPRDVLFLDALPRNSLDKVDRNRLRELAARGRPELARALSAQA